MYFVQKFAGHFLVQNTFHSKMTSYGFKGAHNTYFEILGKRKRKKEEKNYPSGLIRCKIKPVGGQTEIE